ncbi:MAG: calcium/sodium antiporter [Oscillospiraceae bacterium]|nr:calcium/sodium antiporter [Oscillospiraceae bacterium]
MYTLLVFILFAVGLVLIIKGGDYFVDASVWIAKVSGIPQFIIGATIVSIATTMPELIVSLMAALDGKVDMAIGNAVGSVTANSGIILALSVIIAPFAIRSKDYILKTFLLILSILSLYIFSLTGKLSPIGCIILAVILIIFVYENLKSAKSAKSVNSDEVKKSVSKKEIYTNIGKFIFGCAGIIIGARLLVDNGTVIAQILHVPDSIISVTMIAIGTSLPELITAITAIRKKQGALSAGNIIGANIIDTTLILPVCSLAAGKPLTISAQSLKFDLPVCLIVNALIFIPTLMKSKFSRFQGIVVFAVYAAYIAAIVFFA